MHDETRIPALLPSLDEHASFHKRIWRFIAGKWSDTVATVALATLGALVLFPYRHFAGDDAYISFRFAENLATGHGYSFNPDEPTYGATSPLWILLIALPRMLGASVVSTAHALNAVFALLAFLAFSQLCRRMFRKPAARWCAMALFVLDPWFIRWSISGMENALALFLLSASMLAHLNGKSSPRAAWAASIYAGLGILTRPEFAVFAVLLLVSTWLFDERNGIKKAAASGLLMSVIVAPWLVYAMAQFGTIVPNTVTAKMGVARLEVLTRILMYFGSFFVFLAAGIALCMALFPAKIYAAVCNRNVQSRWFLPVSFALALPLSYLVGCPPVGGRYLVFGLPATLLVGVKAWDMLLLHGSRLRHPAIVVSGLFVLSLALVGGVQRHYAWYITKWPEGMDPQMLALGRRLRTITDPGDVIAADQIGVIGYFSERSILDSAALISPDMMPFIRKSDSRVLWDEIRRRGPQWLVTTFDKSQLEQIDPNYKSLSLVDAYDVQREGAAHNGMTIRYCVYRTHWSSAIVTSH